MYDLEMTKSQTLVKPMAPVGRKIHRVLTTHGTRREEDPQNTKSHMTAKTQLK